MIMPSEDQDMRRQFPKDFSSQVFGQFKGLHDDVLSLQSRVGRLETASAAQTVTSQSTLEEVRALKGDISGLGDKVNQGIPAGVYIGAGSLIVAASTLVLAIVAVVGAQAMEPVRQGVVNNNADLREIAKDFRTHMQDGHPQRVEEGVLALDKRVSSIEGNRYSESDPAQDAEINFLKSEVGRLRSTAPDVRIQFLEKEVNRLRGILDDRPKGGIK